MFRGFWVAAGLATLMAGGVAMAQIPAPAPIGGPVAAPLPPPGEVGPQGGPSGMPRDGRPMPPWAMHGMMHRMHHEHDHEHGDEGGRGATFHFRKGDARLDIKCAENEPMKACVDAASALMDKLPK